MHQSILAAETGPDPGPPSQAAEFYDMSMCDPGTNQRPIYLPLLNLLLGYDMNDLSVELSSMSLTEG